MLTTPLKRAGRSGSRLAAARAFSHSSFAVSAFSFALGFLLAALAAIAPAVSFAAISFAAISRGNAFAFGGALFGYLAFSGLSGIIYAAVLVVCFACRATLKPARIYGKKWFMPLCAALALFFTKSAIAFSGTSRDVAILLWESVLCGCCSLFLTCFHKLPLSSSLKVVALPSPAVAAAEKLQFASSAISQLAGAIAAPRRARDSEDISKVYHCAADSVCRKCLIASACWERDFSGTMDSLNSITAELKRKNHIIPEDMPTIFADRCVNLRQFCAAINDEYRGRMRRLASQSREDAQLKLMEQQYRSISGVIDNVAEALSDKPDCCPALERKLTAVAKAYSPGAKASVLTQRNRLFIEISMPTLIDEPDINALRMSLQDACKCPLELPRSVPSRSRAVLSFSQSPRVNATVFCTSQKKSGETTCGDSAVHFRTDDGRAIILLSDGMGTGTAAAKLSASAISLLSGFIRSGCGLLESVAAVIPMLATRFPQSGFVTLDMLEINLYTGDCRMLKYGASASFVLRAGTVLRIDANGMPAGVLGCDESSRPIDFKVNPGDRILMLSDGLPGDSELVSALEKAPPEGLDAIASELVSRAGALGAQDDISVLSINLLPANE